MRIKRVIFVSTVFSKVLSCSQCYISFDKKLNSVIFILFLQSLALNWWINSAWNKLITDSVCRYLGKNFDFPSDKLSFHSCVSDPYCAVRRTELKRDRENLNFIECLGGRADMTCYWTVYGVWEEKKVSKYHRSIVFYPRYLDDGALYWKGDFGEGGRLACLGGEEKKNCLLKASTVKYLSDFHVEIVKAIIYCCT